MTNKLKGWGIIHDYGDSFDIEQGPPDSTNFWLDLRIDVETESEAVISYQLFACSPAGLSLHFEELIQQNRAFLDPQRSYVLGKGVLILPRYDVEVIERAINTELQHLDHYAFDIS